jgi:hypothetical protein
VGCLLARSLAKIAISLVERFFGIAGKTRRLSYVRDGATTLMRMGHLTLPIFRPPLQVCFAGIALGSIDHS